MTQNNQNSDDLFAPTWMNRPIVLYSIRAVEFFVTITMLGLTAHVVNEFFVNEFATSDTMNLALATSSITLAYLFLVTGLTFFEPGSYVTGFFLVGELVVMLLWFCVFIALAADWGPLSCSRPSTTEKYGSYFYFYGLRRLCGSAKAAIAISAVGWALFYWSFLLLVFNVAKPLVKRYRASSLWDRLSKRNFAVHRLTGLAAFSSISQSQDIEDLGIKNDLPTATSNSRQIFADLSLIHI